LEGCQKVTILDYPTASNLFEKVISREPQNVPAHIALADAWSWLGYDDRATEEATKALDLAATLSPEMRLLVKGKYHEIENEFAKAQEAYQALWRLSPDNLDYGLQLIKAQLDSDDGRGALATINTLRNNSPQARKDPRIDLQEAEAADDLEDYAHERAAAENALRKCKSSQQRLLAAEAKRWLGIANRNLGQLDAARLALIDSKNVFAAVGDRLGAALAQQELAEMLADEGDFTEALVFDRELVGFFQSIGNKSNLASAWRDVADVLVAQGDLAGAITAYDDALAAGNNVRDKSTSATVLARKGDLVLWSGDLAASKKLYEQSLRLGRESKDRTTETDTLNSIALALEKEGDLDGAAKTCRDIQAINDLLGKNRNQTGSWRSFVELALESGKAAEAEAMARESVQYFNREKSAVKEAIADNLLALSLLAQGELSQAQAAITRATSILQKNQDLHPRLEATITAARIRAVRGSSAPEKDLDAVLENAKRVGFVGARAGQRDCPCQRGGLKGGPLGQLALYPAGADAAERT
jgi:tetratricopeptide (TPR) repeat protein